MAYYFKPIKSISELQPGMHVRHKINKEKSLVVSGNYGERATAVFTADITNPFEWEVWVEGDEKAQHP